MCMSNSGYICSGTNACTGCSDTSALPVPILSREEGRVGELKRGGFKLKQPQKSCLTLGHVSSPLCEIKPSEILQIWKYLVTTALRQHINALDRLQLLLVALAGSQLPSVY